MLAEDQAIEIIGEAGAKQRHADAGDMLADRPSATVKHRMSKPMAAPVATAAAMPSQRSPLKNRRR